MSRRALPSYLGRASQDKPLCWGHSMQALVVWRPSPVFPHQLTSPGDPQAWCWSVQVLTTDLGGRAVHSHHVQQTWLS